MAKLTEAVDEKSVLAERHNMVFMNTVVTRGRIEAVVTATGMTTEMGRLAGLLAATAEGQTPLQMQLDSLGKRLALIASIVVGLMFVFGLMRGDPLVQTAMTAIALAVAAIPEGLPAVVTVTLALGMHRMAKRNAIEETGRRGDPGVHDGDLLGQDRHADTQSDDGARTVLQWPAS